MGGLRGFGCVSGCLPVWLLACYLPYCCAEHARKTYVLLLMCTIL